MSQQVPDLRSLLKDASPSADEPVGDDGGIPDDVDDAVADEPMEETPVAQAQQPGESATQFALRQKMAEAGFNVDDFESDEDAFSEWLGLTREMHQELQQAEGLKEYLAAKDEFEKWRASGQVSSSQPDSAPAPEVSPKTNESALTDGLPHDMDPAVSKAIQDGYLKQDDKGFFTPIHPSLNGLAEIANKSVMESRRFAQQFVHRPVDTQKKLLQALLPEMLKELMPKSNDEVSTLKSELEQLKQVLQQQQQQVKQTAMKDWVKEHAAVLFVNGDLKNKVPTTVGKEYMQAEEFAKELNPGLEGEQLHQQVLAHLKRRGVKLEVAEPPKKKQEPSSFMSGAKSRGATTRPNGVSLSDYAGNSPSTNPPAMSTRGLPDLNRVIAITQSQATSN
jgi:hypothetical protein